MRLLYVSDNIIQLINQHKSEQDDKRQKLANLWVDENWIFTKWNGELMHVDTVTKNWNKFLSHNPQLPKTNFHSLRHTAATLMIKNNVPISAVSGVLGHAQIGTTVNIYTHVIEDTKREALTVLSKILHNSPKV